MQNRLISLTLSPDLFLCSLVSGLSSSSYLSCVSTCPKGKGPSMRNSAFSVWESKLSKRKTPTTATKPSVINYLDNLFEHFRALHIWWIYSTSVRAATPHISWSPGRLSETEESLSLLLNHSRCPLGQGSLIISIS